MPFGSYVAGRLLQVDTDCCAPCAPAGFNATIPAVFLVTRGNCAFETKSHYAQLAGAQGILIYNLPINRNVDLMDGVGIYNISIPSALISYSLSQAIKRITENVVVNMTFESAKVVGKTDIKFVFALEDAHDVELVGALPAIGDFNDTAVNFSIYFYILDCPQCRFYINNPNCLCNNQYCSIQQPVGAFVLRESIRQQCIFRDSVLNHTYVPYLRYMQSWASNCVADPSQVCSKGFSDAGLDAGRVQSCYLDSFSGNENAADNQILKEAQNAFDGLGLSFVPLILVNGETLYGDSSVSNMNRAICAHMSVSHPACAHLYCAPGCWTEMLSNHLCDPACNVDACGLDSGDCVQPLVLVPPAGNSQQQTSTQSNSTTAQGGDTTSGGTTASGSNQTNSGTTATNSTSTVPLASGGSTTSSSNASSTSSSNPSNTTSTSPTSPPGNTPTSSTNSTAVDPVYGNASLPINSSYPSGWECSPGCSLQALYSSVCISKCNNSHCNYQNWTCTCAPYCVPDLLANSMCDSECNTPACQYDNSSCSKITIPNAFFPGIVMDQSRSDGVLDSNWKKWVIISMSLFGFS